MYKYKLQSNLKDTEMNFGMLPEQETRGFERIDKTKR